MALTNSIKSCWDLIKPCKQCHGPQGLAKLFLQNPEYEEMPLPQLVSLIKHFLHRGPTQPWATILQHIIIALILATNEVLCFGLVV